MSALGSAGCARSQGLTLRLLSGLARGCCHAPRRCGRRRYPRSLLVKKFETGCIRRAAGIS